MDPRLVCEIFVRDKDGNSLSRGSGYPITHNRVLTAHHVLTPEQGRADSIHVCFEYEEVDDQGKPKTQSLTFDATAVSCGATVQGFDVAILAVDIPGNLQPGHLLLHDPPLLDTKVRGQGFPKLTKDQERGKKDAFRGTLRTFTKAETFVQFDVENSPEDKSYWAGASGSGVFDNCEPSRMFGVLTHHSGGKVQSQMRIVPLPALLQLEAFRDAIQYAKEYEPRAKHRDLVVHNVAECLENWRKKDSSSFLAFETLLRECCRKHDFEAADFDLAHFMIDQCPVDALLLAMVELAGEHKAARSQLKKLSTYVVPLNYAIDRVEDLRRFSAEGKSCFLENAVVEQPLSAVIMSGFDAKPVDLNSGAMIDVQRPPTQGLIPPPHDQARRVASFLQELFALFGVKHPDLLRRTVVDQDVADLFEGEDGRNLRARLKARKVALQGRTPYCIVVLDEHPKVRAIQKSVIATVSERVNRTEAVLVFIECRERHDDTAEAERDLLAQFQLLLDYED